MSSDKSESICEIVTIENDGDFKDFIQRSPTGVAIVAEPYGEYKTPVVKADGGDFVKWLGASHPEIKVEAPKDAERLILRSGDHWFPLVFLARDVALPVFLGMVSAYLYDKMKGALAKDKHRIHLSIEYEDRAAGVTKRFNFSGDAEALGKAIKKFDANKFLDGPGA